MFERKDLFHLGQFLPGDTQPVHPRIDLEMSLDCNTLPVQRQGIFPVDQGLH